MLLLALLRIVWRLTHKPPALPANTLAAERLGSHLTHVAMYVLMVAIPLSGWVMVSASPLNLKTELFGLIPWPHIELVEQSGSRDVIAERSHSIHAWLGNTLLLLAVLHVAAAFLHQLVHKDQLINRMLVSVDHQRENDTSFAIVPGALLALAGALYLFSAIDRNTVSAGSSAEQATAVTTDAVTVPSTVGFVATQLGEPVVGNFAEIDVSLSLDTTELNDATLTASVATASVDTGDSQIDGTMVTQDWFASEEFPVATFVSEQFIVLDGSSYIVTGELAIRDVVMPVEFELTLQDNNVGSGEFVINRSDYGIGDAGQDEFVEQKVVISFKVPNSIR